MKLFGNEAAGLDKGHPCCTLDDVEDARQVARRLGIPHYVFNFSEDFEEKVIKPTSGGRPPTPAWTATDF